MTFHVDDSKAPFSGRLTYDPEHGVFDTEPEATGVASILIDDLQLEVDSLGTVLHVWGYCPYPNWQRTTTAPPHHRSGRLISAPKPSRAGVSVRPASQTDWPIFLNRELNWICLGDIQPVSEYDAVEFAEGCVAVLVEDRLVSLWLHPQNTLASLHQLSNIR